MKSKILTFSTEYVKRCPLYRKDEYNLLNLNIDCGLKIYGLYYAKLNQHFILLVLRGQSIDIFRCSSLCFNRLVQNYGYKFEKRNFLACYQR